MFARQQRFVVVVYILSLCSVEAFSCREKKYKAMHICLGTDVNVKELKEHKPTDLGLYFTENLMCSILVYDVSSLSSLTVMASINFLVWLMCTGWIAGDNSWCEFHHQRKCCKQTEHGSINSAAVGHCQLFRRNGRVGQGGKYARVSCIG